MHISTNLNSISDNISRISFGWTNDYAITELPYFTPDKRQCLILGNYDYSAIRFMGVGKDGNPKELGFADLPEV